MIDIPETTEVIPDMSADECMKVVQKFIKTRFFQRVSERFPDTVNYKQGVQCIPYVAHQVHVETGGAIKSTWIRAWLADWFHDYWLKKGYAIY